MNFNRINKSVDQLIYDIIFGAVGRVYLFLTVRSYKERKRKLQMDYDDDYTQVGSILLTKGTALLLFFGIMVCLIAAIISGIKAIL
jgi:hypothetical protein